MMSYRRRPIVVGAAVLAVLALVAGIAAIAMHRTPAENDTDPADLLLAPDQLNVALVAPETYTEHGPDTEGIRTHRFWYYEPSECRQRQLVALESVPPEAKLATLRGQLQDGITVVLGVGSGMPHGYTESRVHAVSGPCSSIEITQKYRGVEKVQRVETKRFTEPRWMKAESEHAVYQMRQSAWSDAPSTNWADSSYTFVGRVRVENYQVSIFGTADDPDGQLEQFPSDLQATLLETLHQQVERLKQL